MARKRSARPLPWVVVVGAGELVAVGELGAGVGPGRTRNTGIAGVDVEAVGADGVSARNAGVGLMPAAARRIELARVDAVGAVVVVPRMIELKGGVVAVGAGVDPVGTLNCVSPMGVRSRTITS
jgi:hypothetical protein